MENNIYNHVSNAVLHVFLKYNRLSNKYLRLIFLSKIQNRSSTEKNSKSNDEKYDKFTGIPKTHTQKNLVGFNNKQLIGKMWKKTKNTLIKK